MTIHEVNKTKSEIPLLRSKSFKNYSLNHAWYNTALPTSNLRSENLLPSNFFAQKSALDCVLVHNKKCLLPTP